MLKEFVKGKVYVFIDEENVFYTQKSLGWRISYEKLMDYFKAECGADLKCFVYKGVDENNYKQKKFLDLLDINGYIVRTKAIKKIRTGKSSYKWKNNLDVELALEMVDLINSYDSVVLMSGDSDFAAPLIRIKNRNKNIVVISSRGRISRELLEIADKYISLDKLRDKISQ